MALACNFIAFQLVWFLSLYGAATGRHWLGSLAFVVFLAAQLRLGRAPAVDLRLAGAAAGCGLVLDSLYAQAGLLRYAAPVPVEGVAPYWILVMWANFGLTLNCSLGWLQRRPLLAAPLAAAGAPPAYLAGLKLGAAESLASAPALYGAVALSWAVAVPALVMLARKLTQSR